MLTTKVLAGVSTTGLLVSQALPLDGWEKLAVDAPLFAILAWTLIRTIPQISADHTEAVTRLSGELREEAHRTNLLLEQALRQSWNEKDKDKD